MIRLLLLSSVCLALLGSAHAQTITNANTLGNIVTAPLTFSGGHVGLNIGPGLTLLNSALNPSEIPGLWTLPAGTSATISASPGLTKISGGGGTTNFTLPTMQAVTNAQGNGQIYIIKDTGIAGTSPQTIIAPSGVTIDGATTVVLNTNFQSISLVPDTTLNVWSRF